MKGLKLKQWTPQPPPEPSYAHAIRTLAVAQVYAKHYQAGQPSTLAEIADKVRMKIRDKIKMNDPSWRQIWGLPSKRTIDRRVNEACEPTWYEDGVPRLASVKAGFYTVNEVRFQNE